MGQSWPPKPLATEAPSRRIKNLLACLDSYQRDVPRSQRRKGSKGAIGGREQSKNQF
jgi:hypothetical protein